MDCVPGSRLAHAGQPAMFEEEAAPRVCTFTGSSLLEFLCVTFLICSCQFISEVAKGIQAQPRGRLERKLCLSVPLEQRHSHLGGPSEGR